MAVSILQTPADFGLAKNPGRLKFRVNTDQYQLDPGAKFQGYVQLSGNPSDGETLTVVSDAFDSITFTFVTGIPTDCGDVSIGFDLAETRIFLLAQLKKNYHLFENYIITLVGIDIIFIARTTGAVFNLSFSGTASKLTGVNTGGVDPSYRDDLKFIFSVWVGVTEVKAIETAFPPLEDSTAEIDIHTILTPYLGTVLPAYNSAVTASAASIIASYFVRVGEYFDEQYHCMETSSTLRAVLAGLPEKYLAGNTFAADHFTSNTARQFLTQIPRGFLSLPKTAPFYLYLYNDTAGTYRLGTTLQYTDGTSTTHYNIMNSALASQVVIYPAGYTQLGIDALRTPSKTVKSWTVFVIVGADLATATRKSELFSINLDINHYEYNRYLIFQNSLGGMDVAWFTGIVEKSQSTTGDTYEVNTPVHNEETVYGEFKADNKTFTNPCVYNSGFKNREYLDYLQDLVKSELIYEMVAGRYIEMRVDTDSVDLYNDKTEQYGLQVDITPAQINRGWAL